MNKTYKVMESDTDFLAAALAQSKVSVWFQPEDDPEGTYHGLWRDSRGIFPE
ncbi:hypothetical protein [Paenibacillus sp. P32E]|uniref:hypothetical protein n=1 Tax=Paenibacillus sp. P32E TaxID=1349434 RepID=UPI0021160946|nr:hypothetical protein [Paenibacillus sp. P32E]